MILIGNTYVKISLHILKMILFIIILIINYNIRKRFSQMGNVFKL